jgi:transposase-like protein
MSTIDGRDANAAAIKRDNQDHGTALASRQDTYLHNLVEQAHRGVQRVLRPMWGCTSFDAAHHTRVGLALSTTSLV